jgi:hypothetical protein
MIDKQAEAILAETFAPLKTDEFFNNIGRTWFNLKASPTHPRRQLFGDDPKRTMLGGYLTHATKLECHAKAPTQAAPAPRPVSSPDEFLELIRSFHERGYTVRVPDVVALAPGLQRFVRALELILRQPVKAAVFWSAAGAQAIVHYDKPHNIIVHLEGRKRWFISTDPPGLQNKWAQVGEAPPNLDRHRIIDVEPGDLIYVPGGTPHTVESTTESLHLAIVFEPVTLREAIIAAVDLLSDNDRAFREPVAGRATEIDFGQLTSQVVDGFSRLLSYGRSEDFLRAAMDLRSARMTSSLPALRKPTSETSVTLATRVRHSPLSLSYLRHSAGSLDFSQPGEHIAVHPGVETELRFIASTDSFQVADVPGASGENVKLALVKRLVDSGFLEVVG